MNNQRVRDIKHAQRESFLLKEIAQFFLHIVQSEPELQTLFINRVKLSPDRSTCVVYFLTQGGLAEFEEKRPTLVLYKPALRTALSKVMQTRYVPNIRFAYDEQYEKQRRVEELIDKLKEEEQS